VRSRAAAVVIAPVDGSSATTVFAQVPAAGAAKIELVRGDQVLASRSRSAHAPRVTLRTPRAGTRVGAKTRVVVSWRASDADRNPLTAAVEYSANGGRSYRTLAANLTGTSITLPGRVLSYTRNARIRVRVNDGFDDALVTSGRLRADGAAPTVRITSPRARTRLANDAAVTLTGEAYDDAGTQLRGRALRWYAGRRLLGTGASLSVNGLPAGTRVLRLRARDGRDRTASASVAMRVRAVPPQFTILRAPPRVSRSARSVRLRLASAVPAEVRIGARRYALTRRSRTISVPIKLGRSAVRLTLRLTAGGRTQVRTVNVARR
jgi:hypothetical protein